MDERRSRVRARPDDLFIFVLPDGRLQVVPRWEANRDAGWYQERTADPGNTGNAIFGRLAAGLPIEIRISAGAQAEFIRWCARRGVPIPIDFASRCLLREDCNA